MTSLHDPLLDWYKRRRRDLPWRRNRDPYGVWVSEVMLQQTQVATVIPYWERWMARYPNVQTLAGADEQEALALWQGLGYYRRCRNLLSGAQYVAASGLPRSLEEWLRVPGVGAYTAGAIASIAQGLPVPLVDGNVERVYARLTADPTSPPGLHRNAWKWAGLNVSPDLPGEWNQALMELGATVCKPERPACADCPIRSACLAFAEGLVDSIPTKPPKVATKALRHVVWVPVFEGRLGLRQIPAGEWWEGMWEFPRSDDPGVLAAMFPDAWPESLGRFRHSVTNHRIEVHAHLVRLDSLVASLRWETPSEMGDLPMPAPQRRVLALASPFLG